MTENKSGFTSREQQNMRGDKRRTFGKQQHSMTEKRWTQYDRKPRKTTGIKQTVKRDSKRACVNLQMDKNKYDIEEKKKIEKQENVMTDKKRYG